MILATIMFGGVSQIEASGVPNAPTFSSGSIRIIVDNDYALFLGSSSTASSLKNQNNVSWPSQISGAGSLDISGEGDYVYFVPMGGGGAENFVGTV
ncbi:MAG: hypothetical protein ACKOBB_00080, partial [Acidimicrobiaceae bacterium]